MIETIILSEEIIKKIYEILNVQNNNIDGPMELQVTVSQFYNKKISEIIEKKKNDKKIIILSEGSPIINYEIFGKILSKEKEKSPEIENEIFLWTKMIKETEYIFVETNPFISTLRAKERNETGDKILTEEYNSLIFSTIKMFLKSQKKTIHYFNNETNDDQIENLKQFEII